MEMIHLKLVHVQKKRVNVLFNHLCVFNGNSDLKENSHSLSLCVCVSPFD